jgi:outer membrane protein OmpA-like peptidoglycan-associated protein
MKSRETSFFWPSYTDLMTSLFFVMPVLYVLTVVALQYQQQATREELRKIKEIQNATKQLDSAYFQYQPTYKRFAPNWQIQFPVGRSTIPAADVDYLRGVGLSIKRLIDRLQSKYQNQNIKYLIVIEGMASRDGYRLNDELSYQRALALRRFWIREAIVLNPNICEVIVGGSGEEGVGREQSEVRNQRILIQIIPKIGTLN